MVKGKFGKTSKILKILWPWLENDKKWYLSGYKFIMRYMYIYTTSIVFFKIERLFRWRGLSHIFKDSKLNARSATLRLTLQVYTHSLSIYKCFLSLMESLFIRSVVFNVQLYWHCTTYFSFSNNCSKTNQFLLEKCPSKFLQNFYCIKPH